MAVMSNDHEAFIENRSIHSYLIRAENVFFLHQEHVMLCMGYVYDIDGMYHLLLTQQHKYVVCTWCV